MTRSDFAVWLLVASSTTGCSACVDGDDEPAQVDADPIAPDATFCVDAWAYAPIHFDPCDIPLPSVPLVLDRGGVYTFNSGSGVFIDPTGASIAVAETVQTLSGAPTHIVSVRSLRIDQGVRLRVNGEPGLLIASWSTVDVRGEIDVSSSSIASGAGARESCAVSLAIDGDNDLAGNSSGGGGGGFGSAGSPGGDSLPLTGGSGGNAIGDPLDVRGGCPGGRGGSSGAGTEGGAGGGAVHIASAVSIELSGTIQAGGEGGAGGAPGQDGGGGGGGSGGYIGLESTAVDVTATAVLAANGGGGGSGYHDQTGGAAGASAAASDVPASGGNQAGGPGGDGGVRGADSGAQGQNAPFTGSSAAGGGGGGVGHIVITADDIAIVNGATITPAPK